MHPSLRACFTTSQLQNAASRRQAADSPFLAGGDSLLSEQSSPSSKAVVVDFYVKATGEHGVQMRHKLANMRPTELQQSRERWQKRAEEMQRFQDLKEEAWSLFRRQGGLGRKTKDDFETEFQRKITPSLDRSSKEDEKSLQKWTDVLRTKAKAEESRRMKQEDSGSQKLRSAMSPRAPSA